MCIYIYTVYNNNNNNNNNNKYIYIQTYIYIYTVCVCIYIYICTYVYNPTKACVKACQNCFPSHLIGHTFSLRDSLIQCSVAVLAASCFLSSTWHLPTINGKKTWASAAVGCPRQYLQIWFNHHWGKRPVPLTSVQSSSEGSKCYVPPDNYIQETYILLYSL